MQEYSSKPDFTHEKIHEIINPKNMKQKPLLKRKQLHSENFGKVFLDEDEIFDDYYENWFVHLRDDEIDTYLDLN